MSEVVKPKRRTPTKATGVFKSVSGSWEVHYVDSDGRRAVETCPRGTSFREAVARRGELVSQVRRGVVRSLQPTLNELATRMLEETRDERSANWQRRRSLLEHHVLPLLGSRKVGKITADDAAKLVRVMSTAKRLRPGTVDEHFVGYAATTQRAAIDSLSWCMQRAVRSGWASADPTRQLLREERPKGQAARRRALEPGELERLIEAATPTFRPIVITLALTGCRIGECLGLTWRHVDRQAGHVFIDGALNRRGERVGTKTASGIRRVPLTPELDRVLLEHRMASAWSRPSDWLFALADGSPRGHRSTMRGISEAADRAGLEDVTCHVLRHGYASALIAAGTDVVTVAATLGHASPNITLGIYGHLYDRDTRADEVRQRVSDGLGRALRAGAGGQP